MTRMFCVPLLLLLSNHGIHAWIPAGQAMRTIIPSSGSLKVASSSSSSTEDTTATGETATTVTVTAPDETSVDDNSILTQQRIGQLRFRELHYELSLRSLPTHGTTGQLRDRLRQAVIPEDEAVECIVNEDGIEDDCSEVRSSIY